MSRPAGRVLDSSRDVNHERDHKEHQEQEEEDFCNAGGKQRDPREAKHRGQNCNDQK